MKESFLSKTMSLSFTSLNPGMTLEPKDTSAWGSLLPYSVGKSPSQTQNRKAETPLRRLKKTLQGKLSLSSKLFLRGLLRKFVPQRRKARKHSFATPSLSVGDFGPAANPAGENSPRDSDRIVQTSIIIPVFNKA